MNILAGTGGKWILPIVVTAPIVHCKIFRICKRVKKEKKLKEEILRDMPQEPIDEPVEPKKPDKTWGDRLCQPEAKKLSKEEFWDSMDPDKLNLTKKDLLEFCNKVLDEWSDK